MVANFGCLADFHGGIAAQVTMTPRAVAICSNIQFYHHDDHRVAPSCLPYISIYFFWDDHSGDITGRGTSFVQLGLPNPNLMEGLKAEHCGRGDSSLEFKPGMYTLKTPLLSLLLSHPHPSGDLR